MSAPRTRHRARSIRKVALSIAVTGALTWSPVALAQEHVFPLDRAVAEIERLKLDPPSLAPTLSYFPGGSSEVRAVGDGFVATQTSSPTDERGRSVLTLSRGSSAESGRQASAERLTETTVRGVPALEGAQVAQCLFWNEMSVPYSACGTNAAADRKLIRQFVEGLEPVGESPDGRGWLALGDSFSSGEGILGTDPSNAQGKEDCRRATGAGVSAVAWSADAYNRVRDQFDFDEIQFVACTGAITDDVISQIREAESNSSRSSWELITLSFGGNNIRFADVIKGCLDVEASWGSFKQDGCDLSEQEMRSRVDVLVGNRTLEGSDFLGTLTMPEMLNKAAASTSPGGDVIVTGYPQPIEEVARWSRWHRSSGLPCKGIKPDDVGLLRSATGYLNQQLALAVQAADRRYEARGVRFHFVDISRDPYESDDGQARHAVCSGDPWINGPTVDIKLDSSDAARSFHPNQLGHTNTGRVVARLLREEIRFDDFTPQKLTFNEDGTPAGVGRFDITAGDATIADAIDAFGRPSRVVSGNGGCDVYWDALGLQGNAANFGDRQGECEPDVGRFQSFVVTSDLFQTEAGLTVGMSEEEIRSRHPEATTRSNGQPALFDFAPPSSSGGSSLYAIRSTRAFDPVIAVAATLTALVGKDGRVVGLEVLPYLAGD